MLLIDSSKLTPTYSTLSIAIKAICDYNKSIIDAFHDNGDMNLRPDEDEDNWIVIMTDRKRDAFNYFTPTVQLANRWFDPIKDKLLVSIFKSINEADQGIKSIFVKLTELGHLINTQNQQMQNSQKQDLINMLGSIQSFLMGIITPIQESHKALSEYNEDVKADRARFMNSTSWNDAFYFKCESWGIQIHPDLSPTGDWGGTDNTLTKILDNLLPGAQKMLLQIDDFRVSWLGITDLLTNMQETINESEDDALINYFNNIDIKASEIEWDNIINITSTLQSF